LPKLLSWFRRNEWELPPPEAVWGERPSLYEHVQRHLLPKGEGLAPGGEELPDESENDSGFRWAAGAFDGSFSHHFAGNEPPERAGEVLRSLLAVLDRAEADRVRVLYDLLRDGGALEIVDSLLESSRTIPEERTERLRLLARWIVTQAPDREPVKVALAILGLFQDAQDRDLFLTLGRHEEFTLYAAVALANSQARPDDCLWELGRSVRGWGRIQIVERLAKTHNPRIRRWLLVEGYKNSVMYEYTAALCARAGGLRAELAKEPPAREVVAAAGDLIAALIQGGPAEDMEDYEDGPAVVERYLEILRTRAETLDQLLTVDAVRRFLSGDEVDWSLLEERGWSPRLRRRLLTACEALIARPEWHQKVETELGSSEPAVYYRAAQAARVLGIDVWDRHFERLRQGDPNLWSAVMRTDDPKRVDRVIALARALLDLDAIASGPTESLGLGPGFELHSRLDFILQELGRFPGHGWELVRAGLRSPSVRNRNIALNSLGAWGRENWPPEAEMALHRALREEPSDDVKMRIEKVLAGQALDDLDDEEEEVEE
jgi:hypothetical protein